MVTQFTQEYLAQRTNDTAHNSKILATAVFVGILFGVFATIILSGMSALGLLGIWVLSMGIAWIGVAMFSQRFYKQAHWGMVVVGQAMGAVAIVLLLISVI